VLFCVDTLSAGGAERQTVELVTRLRQTRFEPRLVCLHAARSGHSLHFAPDLERARVPWHGYDLRWSPSGVLAGWARLIAEVWRVRPVILHAVNHHSNHLARLGRPLMPPRLRLLTAVRTEYQTRQLLYERLEHWVAQRIVCNSPHLERQLRERSRIPAQKLVCIPNGIDCERFGRNPDPGLRTRLAPGATCVIAMLGRITRQKSPHLLAQALGRLRRQEELPAGLKVLIAGEHESDEVQAQLDEAIRRDGLGDLVRQLPPTAQPEALLHAADLTVLASLWEGLPNAVLESLAAGRPVLVSAAANAAGVIEEGITGWVTRTEDVPHLAARLGEILRLSPAQREAMRPACRRRAESFGMARMVQRYEDLYAELAGGVGPGG
jgi:glycosyltransferase involved in cell wall biosynthesis